MVIDSDSASQPEDPNQNHGAEGEGVEDRFEYDLPSSRLHVPTLFDLEIKREDTRKHIVILLLSEQMFVVLLVLVLAVTIPPESLNIRIILAAVSGSTAATMLALRYYFS
jgi:hypothetical protein